MILKTNYCFNWRQKKKGKYQVVQRSRRCPLRPSPETHSFMTEPRRHSSVDVISPLVQFAFVIPSCHSPLSTLSMKSCESHC